MSPKVVSHILVDANRIRGDLSIREDKRVRVQRDGLLIPELPYDISEPLGGVGFLQSSDLGANEITQLSPRSAMKQRTKLMYGFVKASSREGAWSGSKECEWRDVSGGSPISRYYLHAQEI